MRYRAEVSDARPAKSLVTIAGSAGAFGVMQHLLGALPPSLEAAVVVLLHTGPGSSLAATLRFRSRWPVREAVTGDLLQDGCVYVSQPQTHLVVNPDARLTISHAPRVHLFRPSADWLFESAAASFRERHVAVVLSGVLSDGARQLRSVKQVGGMVVAQSPRDARYPSMPAAAIATGLVDEIVAGDGLPEAVWTAVNRWLEQCDAGASTARSTRERRASGAWMHASAS